MLKKLFEKIEDQRLVYFTGKLNLLMGEANQYYGVVYFIDGEIINVECRGVEGLKGFYSMCLNLTTSIDFVIEPELISTNKRKIAYSFNQLRSSFEEVAKKYKEAFANRPPDNLKMLIKSEFIEEGAEITCEEFELLCCLSDFSLVEDIYKYCKMLDYQITSALISLRKKNAIKVIQVK